MANSFGPSGAGGDPVSKSIGDAVDSILPKEVVSKVKQSSKAVSDAVSSFAKGLAAGAQKMKEASVERQYNLLQEIRDEKQFRRDFAAWMKQEAKDELQYKKDIASLMKEEANKELQYRKDISKLIEDQLKYEMDFYELVTRENQKIADEENKAAEDRIRRLREDIQARAAIEDAANRERAGVIASIVSLENQKHREMEQSKKDYLDSVISLEKQKYDTILQDQKDYINSVVSLEKQKYDTIERDRRESLAAQISLINQRAAALKEEQSKKDQEKIAKLRSEEEYRMGGVGRLMDVVKNVVGGFRIFTGLLSDATKFVAAFNPALAFQLGFAFKDLYATIGLALQPVIEGLIAGVRTLADVLVPIAKEFAPLFADLTSAVLDVFVGLIPYLRDFLSVIGLLIQWFTLFIKAIAFLIDPIVMALTGFAVILVVEAIPAVIAFATSVMTMSALMTAGLSLVIGAIAALAFSFLRATGIFKGFEFKSGAAAGMGARQATYSGISEFGKGLLQQGLGSSTATATIQTANNTKRCADLLQEMKDGGGMKKAMGNLMFGGGGPGVKVEPAGGKERRKNANPLLAWAWGVMF